jgi:hypothetical protein
MAISIVASMSMLVSAADNSTSLTIYSSAAPGAISPDLYRPLPGSQASRYYNRSVPGYAVVRQERDIILSPQGRVSFTDVAARIDPTTVSFSLLTDPLTRVLEQNYQFDLVGTHKLLERYLDRIISVKQVVGDQVLTTQGKLLNSAGDLVLMDDRGGIQVIRDYSSISFPELPGGLMTRPTLVWDVSNQDGGKHRARVSYQTQGMTWWADYILTYHEKKGGNECALDVGSWVSIINQSGASYEQAQLKLIAGDVQRVIPGVAGQDAIRAYAARSSPEETGFKERAFFEYHLYTLGRTTTLPDNSTKQLELFPVVHGADCTKLLLFSGLGKHPQGVRATPLMGRTYGGQANKKVDVYLEFRNHERNGLGIPLPSGRIRVNKQDPVDGSLEFIGEDTIDHTAKDEMVRVRMGSAFDVVGERKQLQFRVDSDAKWMTEEIEVTLRNHKQDDVQVLVQENLFRWSSWKITRASHKYSQEDANTIHFPVKVPKDGKLTLNYTVRYTW